MQASQKALGEQKRTHLGSGFCGGFTRGPATRTGTVITVMVDPCPCGRADRYLALTGVCNGSVVVTPAGA